MSDFDMSDPLERLRAGDESALQELGYELVPDEVDEYDEPDWQPEPETFEHQPETVEHQPEFDVDATLRDFNRHIDHLENQTGVKMNADDRKAFIFEVLDSGVFHPSTTENLFYARVQDYEADLVRRSRDKNVPAHVQRNARRERMARAIDKANRS